ncbi:short-chain fatty acid transporter [Algoriphagus kandeliae]|uniref:Short-chain fatty acid transporter n=1 Tax=Algoriphagus kandeliae TaxID=2562278 RepID=A0A4Y9QY03_9BACT|nr:TIGR00366 family protein [Algoriphagus kandeliae]TFV97351.1 short-chain fatty acid transporter [Algoriphagus kandeliae]
MNKKRIAISFPSPFDLVLILSGLVLIAAILALRSQGNSTGESIQMTLLFWKDGFFSLLEFTLQMMMILVFGYALAIAKPIHHFLKKIAHLPQNALQAILFTGLITMLAGLLNWGFGLIVGALLARFVHLALEEKNIPSNSALLASAGYLGMAVWHGGLSGSATLKVAEPNHFLVDRIGQISVDQTIFSLENLGMTLGLVFVFSLVLAILYRSKKNDENPTYSHPLRPIPPGENKRIGLWIGLFMIVLFSWIAFNESQNGLGFFNLNLMNFLLFGLTLFVFRDLKSFTEAVSEGIKSASDIFIQFPFYAGILGMVTYSGLLDQLSNLFLDNADQSFLGPFTLISAAFVNLLIPSGGGQWAVQGPIIMQVTKTLGMDPSKMILVFSYGDQISNLLQPFWALPLLSITGVKASHLIRYTFWLFLAGFGFLMSAVYFFF